MNFKHTFGKFGLRNRSISDDNYELSRRRFIIEGCLSNAVYTLTSGAFLVGYARYLGANDQFNGIIVAIPLLTYMIQMFSPMVLERLTSRKKLIVGLCAFYRTLLGLMVLIPFITNNKSARLTLLAGMYFTAYAAFSFLNPAGASWIISLVPENIRGKYFGVRDMFILASAAVLSIVMGRVLDAFKFHNNEFAGFAVVFCVVLIIAVLNIIMLNRIKEPEAVKLEQNLTLKSLFTLPVKNKNFRKVILLNVVWNLTSQIALPFFAVYMVTGLKLSYTFIMIIGIVMSFTQSPSAKMWGRLSEKIGWEATTVLSIGLVGICHLIWVFVDKNTCFVLIPIIQVLAGVAWAGVNLSLFNIQFKHAPQEGRTIYIGFNAAMAGVAGFSSALAGAVIVGALHGKTIQLGLIKLDNMLFIFGLSGLLILCCAIFFSLWFRTEK
jgi:MFS family permease